MKTTNKDEILAKSLELANDFGWNERMLRHVASDLAVNSQEITRHFPNGCDDLRGYYIESSIEKLSKSTINNEEFSSFRSHEKLRESIIKLLDEQMPHKSAIKRLLASYLLSMNFPAMFRDSFTVINELWYIAGDKSLDWNFYSKRALLTPIFLYTLNYWLYQDIEDSVVANNKLRDIIDKQFSIIMKFGKVKSKISKIIPWG